MDDIKEYLSVQFSKEELETLQAKQNKDSSK
jgi:hypothetical protein